MRAVTLQELTDPGAVLEAVAECDRLSRDAFLTRDGFGAGPLSRARATGRLRTTRKGVPDAPAA